MASFMSTSSGLALISRRRYRMMLIASATALLLNVLLALLLIPTLGARGGALADVVAETAVAIELTIVLARTVPIRWSPISIVRPPILAAGVSSSVLLLPVGAAARAFGATLIYFSLLLLMRAIPAEVMSAFRRIGPLRRAL
jgi:O-antigen/teichoic acid export membrane protein